MSQPIITVDLHGMRREEAGKVIERALSGADNGVYQIKLIHGYNRGTNLRDMILDEFRYHRKILRIEPGENRGITILVLREL